MYSTSQTAVGIVKVDNAGVATNFVTGYTSPEGFDWAFGPPFNGDMFSADVADTGLWRVKSDGTRTLWADLTRAADVAFCNGCLYVVSFAGECFKVCPEIPVSVAFASVRATAVENAVSVEWDVSADETITGFNVYRGIGDTSNLRSLTSGGLLGPQTRGMVDNGAIPGETY